MGTPLYMAPQILQGKPFSSKSDIWSLGVTFYEILYGRVPWEGQDFESFFENVQKQPISYPNKPFRSKGVKELITKMLQIEESDRISWQEVFECQILKKQEQINQPDFINIFQEKDELGKSILINKCYLEQYLVARYLIQDHIVVLEKQKEIALKSFGEVRSKSINYEQDLNSEILLRNQQIETKRKAAMLKYYNYFLFERNVSFFFNFVAQKIILLQQQQLMLPNESYYGLLFFIAKNQLIHLERVNEQFTKKVHEKFNQETWNSFLLSEEFKKLKSLIQKDLKYSFDFFQQISNTFNKTVDINLLKKQISKKKKNFILEIENFNNNSFKIDQGFYHLYHEIIGDNIKELINIKSQAIDYNLLILYLSICLKPYEEFKEITFDFDIFYEQTEQQKLNDIYERLLQKGFQLQILI
ncbi:unnamed protein product [Paramecium primaurelia]|uniref:Protein kinase domain-containing protein n=1 Tax=Paramecium primaurelia TaxID=5886 RepID=A0A8S1PFM7_PARPR|nr:unnamed protein product [Paramecium primaurelia]